MANYFGVSLSVHSKILHSNYSDTSDEFYKVYEIVKNHGYILILNKHEEEIKEKYEAIIKEKDAEILKLENKIKKLQTKVNAYNKIDKCVTYLYENRERLPKRN